MPLSNTIRLIVFYTPTIEVIMYFVWHTGIGQKMYVNYFKICTWCLRL